jgi:hypothetical protein
MTEPIEMEPIERVPIVGWARGVIRWNHELDASYMRCDAIYPTIADLVRETGDNSGTDPEGYYSQISYVRRDPESTFVLCEPAPEGTTYECFTCSVIHPIGLVCVTCRDCDTCDRHVMRSRLTNTCCGDRVCRVCLRANYRQCGDCDSYVHGNEECCTPDYDEDNDSDSSLINGYNHKPRPIFHGDGKLFFGPEIEVEVEYGYDVHEAALVATRNLGTLGYLKADGSLSRGFEIVTHPMSYEYVMSDFPWHMFEELQQAGCTESQSAGIHIHVSREGFTSKAHMYKWLKFIHRNRREVLAFSGRESHYAAMESRHRSDVLSVAKGSRYGDRYQAVNPGNAATLEIRLFASSLDASRIKALFGFAHASIAYAEKLTISELLYDRGWEWESFHNWVVGQNKYVHLYQELEPEECAY